MRKLMCAAATAAILIAGTLPAAGAPQPVKQAIGVVNNAGNLLMFVAVDKGFLSKRGIDVKLTLRDSGGDLSKSLDAGELDFSIAAMSNIPVALERGLKARAVVAFAGSAYTKSADDDMVALVVRPDAGINSIADLKGKKIGVSFGTTSDMYLQEVLKKSGIPLSAVERINVPMSNSVPLFDTGGIPAMVMWEPFNTMMTDKVPGAKVLMRGGGYVCYCTALHGLPETVYKNRDATQAVVDALSETAHFVRNPNNVGEVAQITARYIRGLDPDLFKRTFKHYSIDTRIGPNTFKAFNLSVSQLIEQKKMKAPFDPEKYYDTSFIRRTMERHPEWFKDLPPGS